MKSRLHIIALLAALVLAGSCAQTLPYAPGQDIATLLGACTEGLLDGADLNSFDEAALTPDFLEYFQQKREYVFGEAKSMVDGIKDENLQSKMALRLIFDYRRTLVDRWLDACPEYDVPAMHCDGASDPIAVVYNEEDLLRKCAGIAEGQNAPEKLFERLAAKGYSLDYISDRTLAEAEVSFKKLCAGPGYKIVVVPDCRKMPLEDYLRLLEIAEEGVTVVFEGDMPDTVSGLFKGEEKVNELQEKEDSLQFMTKDSIYYLNYGKGHVVVCKDVYVVLYALGQKGKNI